MARRALSAKEEFAGLVFSGVVCAICLVSLLGELAHIYACLKTGQLVLLALGILAVPIGVIHGLGVLLGVWP